MMKARYASVVSGMLVAIAVSAGELPEAPTPTLSPTDVVQAQLSALRDNSDAGLARVFAFASPGNQAQTGPATHFAMMIRKGYPELLGHAAAELGPIQMEADTATQPVDVTARDGRHFHYLFLLSRQTDGDCPGCWRTDSVLSRPAEDGTAI